MLGGAFLCFEGFEKVLHNLHARKNKEDPKLRQQRLEMSNASGTRITLFRNEPFATPHTTGSSRLALTPVTCCALRERSSCLILYVS
jgi:hypothetical protein